MMLRMHLRMSILMMAGWMTQLNPSRGNAGAAHVQTRLFAREGVRRWPFKSCKSCYPYIYPVRKAWMYIGRPSLIFTA